MRAKYKKGMHLLIKYEGNNGDLIVGRIESVRHDGDITGVNLLTGSRFCKQAEVISKRLVIADKRIALSVLATSKMEAGGYDKKKAREQAVALARLIEGKPEEKFPSPAAKKKIDSAIKVLDALAPEQLHSVLEHLAIRYFQESQKKKN